MGFGVKGSRIDGSRFGLTNRWQGVACIWGLEMFVVSGGGFLALAGFLVLRKMLPDSLIVGSKGWHGL